MKARRLVLTADELPGYSRPLNTTGATARIETLAGLGDLVGIDESELVLKRYLSTVAARLQGALPGLLPLLEYSRTLPDLLRRKCAWPVAAVVDGVTRQNVLGVIMRRAPNTCRLAFVSKHGGAHREVDFRADYLTLSEKRLERVFGTRVDLAFRVATLVRIAEVLECLHQNAWVFGDVSGRNILIADDDVFLVDCDGCRRVGAMSVMGDFHTPGFSPPDGSKTGIPLDRYKFALLVHYVMNPGSILKVRDLTSLASSLNSEGQDLSRRALKFGADIPSCEEWRRYLAATYLAGRTTAQAEQRDWRRRQDIGQAKGMAAKPVAQRAGPWAGSKIPPRSLAVAASIALFVSVAVIGMWGLGTSLERRSIEAGSFSGGAVKGNPSPALGMGEDKAKSPPQGKGRLDEGEGGQVLSGNPEGLRGPKIQSLIVWVETEPAGAWARVDEGEERRTPAVFRLSPGGHQLLIHHPGCETYEELVSADSSKSNRLQIELPCRRLREQLQAASSHLENADYRAALESCRRALSTYPGSGVAAELCSRVETALQILRMSED